MDWDELYKDPAFRIQEPAEEVVAFLSHLRANGARSVLDIGCGAGRHVVFLAQRRYAVHGIDVSARGLRYSREWLHAEGLAARLCLADMIALPYDDSTFDAALSRGVITHTTLPGVRRGLREAHRVLRSDGLFLCTFISTESSLMGKGTRIDDDTWICDDESEAGITHHFMTRERVLEESSPYFEPIDLYHLRHGGLIDTGRPYVSAHWILVGRATGAVRDV